MLLIPSLNISLVNIEAVVVPSPESFDVLFATCFINDAPIFSNLFLNSICFVIVTPSFVIFASPKSVSYIMFLPFGPNVRETVFVSLFTPFNK